MKKVKKDFLKFAVAAILAVVIFGSTAAAKISVKITVTDNASAKIHYGVENLQKAIADTGGKSKVASSQKVSVESNTISVGMAADGGIFTDALKDKSQKPESYAIVCRPRSSIVIAGADDAGVMYGCLELAKRISDTGKLPTELNVVESPSLKMRGTCIFFMKLGLYDYPVTPEEFPFFYDKQLWIEYLDFLAANKFNYIAFWNGHPFDYFVKLDKYPEAQSSLSAELLQRNHEMLMWLGTEAQKRNIWLMFQFYNIHVSVDFAKAHKLPKHGISEPTPLLEDYTSYCIEKFVGEFPSIGLYICPGESLRLDKTDEWIDKVIFGAVKKTGKNPPIMIRSWGIDIERTKKLVGRYSPLYTERKFNVEHIVSTEVDPANKDWSQITGDHVVNVHCVGNLEPFRWSPPSYIQKCIQSSISDGGATGLHLYPRKVWRWPYGCDKVDKPELQWRRDRLWFEVWGRYAWNSQNDPANEREYWINNLMRQYGTREAAEYLLNAYEAAADVLPGFQRLLWPGHDNHTITTAGMRLDAMQKTKGVPFLKVPGMIRMPAYIESVKNGTSIDGTTPIEFLAQKIVEAEKALTEAKLAVAAATKNKEDAERIASDAEAVVLLAKFYHSKAKAAVAKAVFDAGKDPNANGRECMTNLKDSLEKFRELTTLTTQTYGSLSDCPDWHYGGKLPCPYHWKDIFPILEKEYAEIEKSISAGVARKAASSVDCYEEIHPFYLEVNVPANIHIKNTADIEKVRGSIINYLWKGAGWPGDKMPVSITPVPESNMPVWIKAVESGNLKKVDRLDIEMDYQMHSYSYLLHAKKSVNRLLIFQMGHANEIISYGGKETIRYFLDKGFDIMTFWMPLFAGNSRTAYDVQGFGNITFPDNAHNQMSQKLENLRGSFIRFFLEPVIVGINYAENNYNYKDISMTGVSGGGWTTHLCAAIDPRIKFSMPVAGSLPLYLRTGPCSNGSLGDDEQTWPALYKDTASWEDIYILGGYGKGRSQIHILNKYDTCCFGGVNYQTFEPYVSGVVKQLGQGSYRVYLDTSHKSHKISQAVIEQVMYQLLLPMDKTVH